MSERATGVRLDPRYGHISLHNDGQPLVTMVDTGPQLELWSMQGAIFGPDVADALAEALTEWVARKKRAAA
jgi:hypothetical protein